MIMVNRNVDIVGITIKVLRYYNKGNVGFIGIMVMVMLVSWIFC